MGGDIETGDTCSLTVSSHSAPGRALHTAFDQRLDVREAKKTNSPALTGAADVARANHPGVGVSHQLRRRETVERPDGFGAFPLGIRMCILCLMVHMHAPIMLKMLLASLTPKRKISQQDESPWRVPQHVDPK